MSEKQALLHHAKEEKYGQSRAYTIGEVDALIKLTLFLGFVGIVLGILIGGVVGLFVELVGFTHGLFGGAAVGATLAAIPILRKAVNEQIDGLRSYEARSVKTYTPPQPELTQDVPWRPPIPVHGQGETRLLDMNEKPMLPDPQVARQITPPVVAEILKASIEQYDGKWSRRKLMRLQILGRKVTRGMYEELTNALHQCGILQQDRQGGYELPHDVTSVEDLRKYFPGLGGMGGRTGRDGNGGALEGSQSPSGEVTLAEQRRQRWLECNHDVKKYLGNE